MACVRKWRGSWVVDYRDNSGRRIIQKAESKKDANEKLTKILQLLKGGNFDPIRAKVTLEEYAPTWLETRRPEIKPSTMTSYEYTLRVHILPALGKIPLGKLSREAVKRLLTEKVKAGLSRDTVRVIHATLRVLLEDAVDSEILPTNVARRAGKFTKSKAERQEKIQFFSRGELSLFLDTARRHAPDLDHCALFFCLARTGLRIGEALALQVGDLDFLNYQIEVRRNLVKSKIGTPKGGRFRRVDMSMQLSQVLNAVVAKRKEELLRQGKTTDELPTAWLFQNRAGGPLDDSKVRKLFNRLVAKAGLVRRNLHSLRHTFASLLIQNGESLAYVRDQLGHSSIQITVDTYGHLVPGGNRQAVNKLDDDFDAVTETSWKQMETFGGLAAAGGEKNQSQVIEKIGATRRIRTGDLLITNQLLYRLS